MQKPITSRPLDLVYLIFFITHIPIMFMVDLYPLYPTFIPNRFTFLTSIRTYYITTYRDRFFAGPVPTWFYTYLWMELLLHVPVSLYAIRSLLGRREDPVLPLPLLVLAVQIAVTTGTCIAEALSWEGFSNGEKASLMALYVPYLLFALFMGTDMYGRAKSKLMRDAEMVEGKKKI